MSGPDLVLAALALLTCFAGARAVTSRQVVHAALWLVVALGTLAGVYLVLGAEVVALVQLLVYVGAIVVLVLFALMLTRAPIGPPDVRHGMDAHGTDQPAGQRIVAALAGVAVAALVGGTTLAALGGELVRVLPGRGSAASVGRVLFGSWVLPFELLSVLLLAALVAALAISRRGAGRGAGR